jgi:hypothetical protein
MSQKRRLSAPAGSQQKKQLSLHDLEIHVINRHMRTESLREVIDGNGNHRDGEGECRKSGRAMNGNGNLGRSDFEFSV